MSSQANHLLPTVVVGMSGGVDSSVAAAILTGQGYPVIGVMLRLWSEPGAEDSNRCCTPDAMSIARRVCAKLDISFYAIDAQEVFYQEIVQFFLSEYKKGRTPNPCIRCNNLIRWGILMKVAGDMGAEYLATGHYARIIKKENGLFELHKGLDPEKDQSYVLSGLNQSQISRTLLPLGEFTKSQVREIAKQLGLASAKRPESQDLCFLGGGDYRDFLRRNTPDLEQPGRIMDQRGNILGEHNGLSNYTIGQRKGLRIAYSEPLYVIRIDTALNTLFVGTLSELGSQITYVGEMNWIPDRYPATKFRSEVKIRYRSQLFPGMVEVIDPFRIKVIFDYPLRDITPGQIACLYDNDRVLGSGVILGSTVEEVK